MQIYENTDTLCINLHLCIAFLRPIPNLNYHNYAKPQPPLILTLPLKDMYSLLQLKSYFVVTTIVLSILRIYFRTEGGIYYQETWVVRNQTSNKQVNS